MSGAYQRLRPGRYQLVVQTGEGPAGIRRAEGEDVAVGVEGGTRDFAVRRNERVYYWWRGPARRRGVQLLRSPERVRSLVAATRNNVRERSRTIRGPGAGRDPATSPVVLSRGST